MKFNRVALASVPIVLALLALAGCNKAKLNAIVTKAQTAATKAADTARQQVTEQLDSAGAEVQEQLQMAGKIQLALDAPIETKACYARFIPQGSDRAAVFELRSYSSPDNEAHPSVFFHAQIRAASAAELSGQVVSGRLFVQPQADGPVWYSAAGSPVELQIAEIVDNVLTAEIVSASLQNTRTGASIAATGTFSAVQQ